MNNTQIESIIAELLRAKDVENMHIQKLNNLHQEIADTEHRKRLASEVVFNLSAELGRLIADLPIADREKILERVQD